MRPQRFRTLAVLIVGVSLGAAVHAFLWPKTSPAMAQESEPGSELNRIVKEIETIKGKLPDQAHAMQDVGYHFSNLWFAGQRRHWELANFYWPALFPCGRTTPATMWTCK